MPENPDEIVTILEALLAEAREGRVLFLLASVGHVTAPQPAPGAGSTPTAMPFRVSVAAFLGEQTSSLHSASLESAHRDVQKGIRHAAVKMTQAVEVEVATRREAERKRS